MAVQKRTRCHWTLGGPDRHEVPAKKGGWFRIGHVVLLGGTEIVDDEPFRSWSKRWTLRLERTVILDGRC